MAPAPIYKNPAGNQAGSRTVSQARVVPAIPIPLMARRQQSTAPGSPIPRHLVQTPVQTPRNGTPELSLENLNLNGNHGNIPPTPSSTTNSTAEAQNGSVHSNEPASPAVTTSEVVTNGDHPATTQTTPLQYSPSTQPSDRSNESVDTHLATILRDPFGYFGIEDGTPVSPPYTFGGPGLPAMRRQPGFGPFRNTGVVVAHSQLASGNSANGPSVTGLMSRAENGPSFLEDVDRVSPNACIGSFEAPHSTFPPLHQPALATVLEAGAMLVEYARNNFMKYDTTDCVVNFYLRAPSGDQIGMPDLHLPGHRFVLGMSPTLQGCLAQPPVMQVPAGLRMDAPSFAIPTWSITIADPNLTIEALVRALQVLYGFTIFEAVVQAPPASAPLARPLALIVAGFHLQLPRVMWAGVDICIYNLTWNDVEHVLSFCLAEASGLNCPIHSDLPAFPLPFTRFEYSFDGGDHIRRLLIEVMGFMAVKFPAGFKLDQTAADGQIRRIPDYPDSRTTISFATADPSSRVPSVSGKATKDPRLTAIRFGDLSPPTDEGQAGAQTNGAETGSANAAGASLDSLLSRLLINLPSDLLKFLLEHPQLCQESGGISHRDRKAAMAAVLAERERRRVAARSAVLDCRVPKWDMAMQRLSHSQPPFAQPPFAQPGDESWDALGWREGIANPPDSMPRVYRVWQPLIASRTTPMGSLGGAYAGPSA